MANQQFAEDVLSLVGEKPVLLSDLISTLRGGNYAYRRLPGGRTWRNVREQDVTDLLREFGAYFRGCRHGSGWSDYVATVPFDTVVNGRGRTVEVTR